MCATALVQGCEYFRRDKRTNWLKKKPTHVQTHVIKWCWCFKMSWSSLPITVLLKLKSCHDMSTSPSNLDRHRWARTCPQFSSGENVSYLSGPHGLPMGCGQRLDPSCLPLAQVPWLCVLSPGQLCVTESLFWYHIQKSAFSIKMVQENAFYWWISLTVAVKWTGSPPPLFSEHL